MSTIRKLPSGKFQAIVRLKNLKPIYATFPTKAKAKQWAKTVESDTSLARKLAYKGDLELRQAIQIDTSKGSVRCFVPTFSEWIDQYISNTNFKDQSMLGRLNYWKNRFHNKLIVEVEPEDIDDALLELSRERTGSTLNRYKSNLSSLFIAFNKDPVFKRLKFSNPVRSEFVSSFSENSGKDRFLSTEEQKRLLNSAKESHWEKLYLLVLLALTTGARRGELLGLRWCDIDFHSRTALLNITKNGEPRILPLLPETIAELMRFRKNNDSLVFHSTTDLHSPFDFKKAWNNALKKANIENCRFHDLRHTAASNMVSSGRTLFETGTLLGHKQSNTTMRYAHLAHHHTSEMVDEVWSKIHRKDNG